MRWTSPTQRQGLGKLAGFSNALAEGINQAGTIVGFASTANFLNARAFIWTQAGGIKPLPDLEAAAVWRWGSTPRESPLAFRPILSR